MRFALCGIDAGPRAALAPLAGQDGFEWVLQCDGESPPGWSILGRDDRPDALVVGTSRSRSAAAQEALFRRSAREAGVPIVAIEDYPGNYQHIECGEADLLVVESELATDLARARLGRHCPRLVTGASLRYDEYRASASRLRRNRSDTDSPPRVLWIGQPETEDMVYSLERLLPEFRPLGVELLFRAHPRDVGYSSGAYNALFERHAVFPKDVSRIGPGEILELSPRLLLTQFSSLAIEFGFLGIPVLHVLYAPAGGRRLRELTGAAMPLLCQAEGGDTIVADSETGRKLRQAIFDDDMRSRFVQRFDAYFQVDTPQAGQVASCIRRFIEQRTAHQSEVT